MVSSKCTVPVNEDSDSHFPLHHSGRPSPEHQKTLLLSEHCGGPPDERREEGRGRKEKGGERKRGGEGRGGEREAEGRGRPKNEKKAPEKYLRRA